MMSLQQSNINIAFRWKPPLDVALTQLYTTRNHAYTTNATRCSGPLTKLYKTDRCSFNFAQYAVVAHNFQ